MERIPMIWTGTYWYGVSLEPTKYGVNAIYTSEDGLNQTMVGFTPAPIHFANNHKPLNLTHIENSDKLIFGEQTSEGVKLYQSSDRGVNWGAGTTSGTAAKAAIGVEQVAARSGSVGLCALASADEANASVGYTPNSGLTWIFDTKSRFFYITPRMTYHLSKSYFVVVGKETSSSTSFNYKTTATGQSWSAVKVHSLGENSDLDYLTYGNGRSLLTTTGLRSALFDGNAWATLSPLNKVKGYWCKNKFYGISDDSLYYLLGTIWVDLPTPPFTPFFLMQNDSTPLICIDTEGVAWISEDEGNSWAPYN